MTHIVQTMMNETGLQIKKKIILIVQAVLKNLFRFSVEKEEQKAFKFFSFLG